MEVTKTGAIVIGLAIAALAQFVAMMLGGAGHGWTMPFLFSVFLFAAWPVTLVRMKPAPGRSFVADVALLLLGVIASLLLLVATMDEAEYFWRVVELDGGLPLVILWLALWFGWQLLTLANIGLRRDT